MATIESRYDLIRKRTDRPKAKPKAKPKIKVPKPSTTGRTGTNTVDKYGRETYTKPGHKGWKIDTGTPGRAPTPKMKTPDEVVLHTPVKAKKASTITTFKSGASVLDLGKTPSKAKQAAGAALLRAKAPKVTSSGTAPQAKSKWGPKGPYRMPKASTKVADTSTSTGVGGAVLKGLGFAEVGAAAVYAGTRGAKPKGTVLKAAFDKIDRQKSQAATNKAAEGTKLRHAFEAVERSDLRKQIATVQSEINVAKAPKHTPGPHPPKAHPNVEAAKTIPTVTVPKTVGAKVKIAEQRAQGKPTVATQETSMTDAAQDARAKAAVTKATAGFQDRETAVQKSEQRESARRQITRTAGSGGRRTGDPVVKAAKPKTKPVTVTPPKTVSEKQKKAADRKYFKKVGASIEASKNKINPQVAVEPIRVQPAKLDENLAREKKIMTELAKHEGIQGGAPQYKPVPGGKDARTAAQITGTTEAEVAKVARKIPTVAVPESITVKPRSKQAVKRTPTETRGLPKRSAGFEAGEAPKTETASVRDLVKEVRAQTGTPGTGKEALARGVADKIHKEDKARDKKIKSLEAQIKAKGESEAKAPKVSKEQAYRDYEELKVETKVKAAKAKSQTGRLPMPKADTRVTASRADLIAEQRGARAKPPTTPPKIHAPVEKPVERNVEANLKRYEARQAKVAPKAHVKLTSPMLEVAGSKAKTTAKRASVVANARRGAGKVGGVLGAGLLASLVIAETAEAAYKAPAGQKLQAAKRTAKKAGTNVAVTVGAFSAGLKALSMVSAKAGAVGSGLLSAAAVPSIALTGFNIGSMGGKEYAQIGAARKTAKREKAYSEQFYGTVEKATKTRHAKEAFKRNQKKDKAKDILTG